MSKYQIQIKNLRAEASENISKDVLTKIIKEIKKNKISALPNTYSYSLEYHIKKTCHSYSNLHTHWKLTLKFVSGVCGKWVCNVSSTWLAIERKTKQNKTNTCIWITNLTKSDLKSYHLIITSLFQWSCSLEWNGYQKYPKGSFTQNKQSGPI